MAKRRLFDELVEGVESLRGDHVGKLTLTKTTLTKKEPVELKAAEVVQIRESLKMSQAVFAAKVRVNPRTYPRYEKEGIKGPQAAIIKLIGRNPILIDELEAL